MVGSVINMDENFTRLGLIVTFIVLTWFGVQLLRILSLIGM